MPSLTCKNKQNWADLSRIWITLGEGAEGPQWGTQNECEHGDKAEQLTLTLIFLCFQVWVPRPHLLDPGARGAESQGYHR